MVLQDARTELPTDHLIHLYKAFKEVGFMCDVLGEKAKTDLLGLEDGSFCRVVTAQTQGPCLDSDFVCPAPTGGNKPDVHL